MPAKIMGIAHSSRMSPPALPSCLCARFRSVERVSFGIAPKETKRSSPDIRPRLRRGSLVPSSFRGPAWKGHPWPIRPLAASMRLVPLHDDSTRPPEGTIGVVSCFCARETLQSQSNDRPLLPCSSLLCRLENREQLLRPTSCQKNQADLWQSVASNKNDYKNLKNAVF